MVKAYISFHLQLVQEVLERSDETHIHDEWTKSNSRKANTRRANLREFTSDPK